jgi:hypothetical protein
MELVAIAWSAVDDKRPEPKPRTSWILCLVQNMTTKRQRKGSTFRIVMLIAGLALIPPLWILANIREYRAELATVERIQKVAPDSVAVFQYRGPAWIAKIGFTPPWLTRVDDFDATGTIFGKNKRFAPEQIPFDFDDADLAAIKNDLKQLRHLNHLYLPWTKLTDESAPMLREFDSLRFMNLQQTAMTSAAVKQLEKDLPNTKIPFFHDDALGKRKGPAY